LCSLLGRVARSPRVIALFGRSSDGGLIVTGSALAAVHRDLIVALAARHRLPAVYPFRYFTTGGGLISYGPDSIDPRFKAQGSCVPDPDSCTAANIPAFSSAAESSNSYVSKTSPLCRPGNRRRNFPRRVDEKLSQRTERAILDRDDSGRNPRGWQIDR
jgi:hypothetical protein